MVFDIDIVTPYGEIGPVPATSNRVCITARNASGGADRSLGCWGSGSTALTNLWPGTALPGVSASPLTVTVGAGEATVSGTAIDFSRFERSSGALLPDCPVVGRFHQRHPGGAHRRHLVRLQRDGDRHRGGHAVLPRGLGIVPRLRSHGGLQHSERPAGCVSARWLDRRRAVVVHSLLALVAATTTACNPGDPIGNFEHDHRRSKCHLHPGVGGPIVLHLPRRCRSTSTSTGVGPAPPSPMMIAPMSA